MHAASRGIIIIIIITASSAGAFSEEYRTEGNGGYSTGVVDKHHTR